MSKDIKPKQKVIVRNLPSQLSQEQFEKSIEKWLPFVDFWYFVPGKTGTKSSQTSRAYLNFTSEDALYDFNSNFSNHAYVIERGFEKKPIIEYAPSQKIPKGKQKEDAREGSLESDADYKQFLEELQEPVQLLPSAEKQLEEREEKEKETSASQTAPTPLLEYIKQKYANKAIKMARRQERAERRKRSKDKEKKPDEKMKLKERNRKGARDERRKKKKEGEKKDEKREKLAGEGKEDERRGKNGVWMVRKHLEPGSITIQTREPVEPKEDAPASTSAPIRTATSTQRNGAIPTRGGKSTRRPREPRMKIYAPKQKPVAQETVQIPASSDQTNK